MRIYLLGLLFISCVSYGQKGWQVEVMPGISSYAGDLTQKTIPIHTIQPSLSTNIKYNTGNFVNFRLGLAWAMVSGNDKYNSHWDLYGRNLSFKSTILEGNLCLELNLADPDIYYSYPYIFGGVGVFHFNPWAYDDAHNKVFLKPLSTEGEGLAQYPSIKEYSLTQLCLPFGAGWRHKVKEKFIIGFEIGIRYLFTDYLDDLSNTYVDRETLQSQKGDKAVEMAFRSTYFSATGDTRGNPKVKDIYAFAGIKFGFYLHKKKK